MKVHADLERCASSGMCAMLAPAVFELDKTSTLVVLVAEVPEEHVTAVQDAIACCPTEAISVSD
jgi:ferredoxin